MKYAAYPNYKPADAPWLKVLPMDWSQIRGRFVMAVNPPARRARTLNETDEVSFVPMEAVGEYGGLDLDRTKPLDEIGAGYTAFEDGDVVVAKITPCFENGKGAIARGLKNGVGFGTTELHVLRTGKHLDKQFLFYLTISHTFRILGESEMYGAGGQKRVPPEFAKDFRIPLPPLAEQQTIARFLDAKTAQIDALIAKKRQLIDKLKEKRQALIARTVTRGLPPEAAQAAGLEPNPEMRSAEVEWLDEYPCTWSLVPLKYLAAIRYGIGEPPEYVNDGVPLIRATNVDAGFIREKGLVRVNPIDIPAKRIVWLREGDIIVVRSGAYTADSARIPAGFEGSIAGFDMVVSPRKIESRFLAYALLSRYFKDGQLDIQKMRAAQPHLNAEELGGSAVCVPSEREQSLIADYLDRETTHIDRLIELAEAVVQSTTEYRQALITSAVTGKIDVRDFAHAETEVV